MREYEVNCPHCGQKLTMYFSKENGNLIVSFSDIEDDVNSLVLAKEIGMDLGVVHQARKEDKK